MTILNTFANQSGQIPLSELDTNFAAPITIGATSITLGQTAEIVTGLTLAGANIGTPIGNLSNCTFPILNQNTTGNAATATVVSTLPQLSASTGSTLVSTETSGTGAVTRTVASKLNDVISVKDFGAVGDGVTDDSRAIKAALDYANSIGGGSVYLPAGTYLKKDLSSSPSEYVVLYVYSNTTLFGDGDSSVILFDDTDTNSRNDLLNCYTGSSNIVFRDFKVLGTYYTYPNQTNQSQTFTGSSISKLRIENVTIDSVRFMAMAFDKSNDAIVTGCRLSTVQRDGFRFTQSMNVVIANNTAKWVGDNVVALHTDNSNVFDTSLTGGSVVSNNVFEGCLFSLFLGARKLTISNNQWVRCIGAIQLSYNTSSEGDTPKYAITITDNTITDNFSQYGSSPVDVMDFNGNPRRTGGTTYPGSPNPITGLNDTPYGLYDLNNVSTNKTRNPGDSGLVIANNIIKRTLPLTAAYSNYGFGLVFDPNLNGGFYDPAVTENQITKYAMRFVSSWQDVTIANNIIEGLSNIATSMAISFNYNGAGSVVTISIASPAVVGWVAHGLVANQTIKFTTTGALPTGLTVGTEYYVISPLTDSFNVSATYAGTPIVTSGTQSGVHACATYEPNMLQNFNILNNTFKDCPSGAIYDNLGASGTAINMTVAGNDFNLDPYYRGLSRAAGNTWANAGGCQAVAYAGANGFTINNNQFRNCSYPGFSDANSTNNIVFAQPVAIGYNASNRGVGTLSTPANSNKIIAIQGDPTLPNYEAITGEPLSASSAMPSTGTYVTGTFVANSSVTSSTTILGWKRITIGSNHVLGTDWLEVDCLPVQTGNSGKLITTNGSTPSFSNTLSSLTTTGNITLGNDYTTSALKVGTNGSYIGRNTGDGSTYINTGQANITFLYQGAIRAYIDSTGTTTSVLGYNIGTNGSSILRNVGDGSTQVTTGNNSYISYILTGSEKIRFDASGNILVGTATTVASAKIAMSSTTQGFLPPVMTTTQKNAIATPVAGLIVFDSTLAKLCVYSGSAWQTITSV